MSSMISVMSITLVRPCTFTNTSGQMGSNLTPIIFRCSMTPPAVCLTVLELLSFDKVIDHKWTLYQTFLKLIIVAVSCG